MHPVIRVISYLVFATYLSQARVPQIALALLMLLSVAVLQRGVHFSKAVRMLKRLRWLFLSILIIYLWFTPGEPIFQVMNAAWIPSWQGIQTGGIRAMALALMILAVGYLISTTPQTQLLGALYWLCAPLKIIGLSRDRLAVRTMLAMSAAEQLQQIFAARSWGKLTGRGTLARIAEAAASIFAEVLQRAEAAPCEPVEFNRLASPPLWQWLYPCLLIGVFWQLGRISVAWP